jgi:hypothetical protein
MKIAYVLYPDFTALDLVAPTTRNPRSPPARRPPPTPARSVWHYASYWGTARCRWRRGSTVRAQRRDSAALGGRSPNDGRASDTRGGCLAAWVATSGHSNTRSASRPSFLWQSEIAAVPEKRGVPGSSPFRHARGDGIHARDRGRRPDGSSPGLAISGSPCKCAASAQPRAASR